MTAACRDSRRAPSPVRGPARRAGRTFVLAVASAGLAASLGGCATSPDPHDGGFVSGIVGLAGGGYQRRIDAREVQHGEAVAEGVRLAQEKDDLEAQRVQVRAELSRAEARLAAQEQRIRTARAQLAASRSAAAEAQRRRLDQAEARLIKTRGAVKSTQVSQAPVSDLKSRAQGFQREMDDIDAAIAASAAL